MNDLGEKKLSLDEKMCNRLTARREEIVKSSNTTAWKFAASVMCRGAEFCVLILLSNSLY